MLPLAVLLVGCAVAPPPDALLLGGGGSTDRAASAPDGAMAGDGLRHDPAPIAACIAPPGPELVWSTRAALIDGRTGTLLYGVRPDVPWPPASLTKLVTLAVALDAADRGVWDLDAVAAPHPEAWASALPPGSSLMFLGPDQRVDGFDLLRGLMIASGNDAAVEIALRVSGSVAAFAEEQTRLARRYGLGAATFEEPSGLSAQNAMSPRALALLSADLLARYPTYADDLYAAPRFAYPEARHRLDGLDAPIVQFNRNGLLQRYDGASGLKTGFIEESGYNLAASAERNGVTLVATVMGVQADDHGIGALRRERDAAALLDWGFEHFSTVSVRVPDPVTIATFGSDRRTVAASSPRSGATIELTVPRDATVSGVVRAPSATWGSAAAGTIVGAVVYRVDGCDIATLPIALDSDVGEASPLRLVLDRIRWPRRVRDG